MKMAIRLYRSSWVNPNPEKAIQTIDYRSTMAVPSPFLIAISGSD